MGFFSSVLGAVGGGLLSGIGDILGGRKQRKEATRAGGTILGETGEAFETARNRLLPFLPAAEQRGELAGEGITNVLTALTTPGGLAPSERALGTIEELSRRATERAAASGRSQSGGLQGELESIRTREILADERGRRHDQLNTLRTLMPVTRDPLALQGTLADLDLDELQRKTAARRNQLAGVTSAIGKQFSGIQRSANIGLESRGFNQGGR